MQRLYVYTGALIIIGLSIGVPAASALLSGMTGLPTVLMAIGGVGMVVGAGYEAVRTDPAAFTAPTLVLALLVVGAGLALLGTLLTVASGG